MLSRTKAWRLLGGLLFGVCLCALGARANTVELELISGGLTSGVIVGTPCGTGSSCVQFNGTVGAWTINLASGVSNGPVDPFMDLSSFNATSAAGAAPLSVLLTDTFSSPSIMFNLASSGTLISGSGTAMLSAYLDSGNTLFANCGTTCTASDLIGTLGSFSGSYATNASFTLNSVPSYALTENMTLTDLGSTGLMWSTDSSIQGVPEPSTLMLLGTAGLLLMFARRRMGIVTA